MSAAPLNSPKESQLNKGRSGKPNARKKRIVSAQYLLRKFAKENIAIEVRGVQVVVGNKYGGLPAPAAPPRAHQ